MHKQPRAADAFTQVGSEECARTFGGTDVLRLMATVAHHQADSQGGHHIDMSVCDLATFDFKQCLG